MRSLTLLVTVILLSLLTVGCSSSQRIADDVITLDTVGSIEVDVESFGGDVIIVADPSFTGTTVQVERIARFGRERKDEAEASLEQIQYNAEIIGTETGQVLQITASTDHAEPYLQAANIVIETPGVSAVRVKTEHGKVHAKMINGPVQIDTTDGDVRVMTNHGMTYPAQITNQDGDIDYRVRGNSTGLIKAQAINGQVDARVKLGRFRIERGTTEDTLIGILNEGANQITLTTMNGNIRIAVVENPMKVGQFIFEP